VVTEDGSWKADSKKPGFELWLLTYNCAASVKKERIIHDFGDPQRY